MAIKHTLTVTGLVLLTALGLAFGIPAYTHYEIKKNLDLIALGLWDVAEIQYQDVSTTFGGELHIYALTVTPADVDDTLTIDELVIQTPGLRFLLNSADHFRRGDFPKSLTASVRQLAIATDGPLLRLIDEAMRASYPTTTRKTPGICARPYAVAFAEQRKLGLEQWQADLALGYEWNPETEVLRLYGYGRNALHDEAELDLRVVIPTAEGLADRSLHEPSKLVSARLRVNEKGTIGALAEYCQSRQDLPRDTFIDRLVNRPDRWYAAQWGLIPGKGIRQAYRRSLLEESEIILEMRPHQPIALADLAAYRSPVLIQRLNLNILVDNTPVDDLQFRLADKPAQHRLGEQLLAKLPTLKRFTQPADDPPAPSTTTATSAPSPAPRRWVRKRFQVVASDQLSRHIGADVRIHTTDGHVRKGWLSAFKNGAATIRWRVYGGEMETVVPLPKISKSEVLLAETPARDRR